MGLNKQYGDRLRQRIRSERERRGWSQAHLARMFPTPLGIYPSTVAKIESGERAVRVDEVGVLADIFGVSVDALMGRASSGTDLVWAMNRLSSNAQKSAGEVAMIMDRLNGGVSDVLEYAGDGHRPRELLDSGFKTLAALQVAVNALTKLAGEFPRVGT